MKEIVCLKEMELLSFLEGDNLSFSHKKAKSLLKYGMVKVNGKVRTTYNFMIHKNDKIAVDTKTKNVEHSFDILFEDKDIIVVYKKEGLLTIAIEREKENTLYYKVREYVKKQNPRNVLFIVHRLDKETSGILLFAKSEKVKKQLQENWNEFVEKRGYTAIVEGTLKDEGTLISYLMEDKNGRVFSSKSPKNGKKAITKYKVLKRNEEYSLLDIELETGRKNQIRVQFSSIGTPILGDHKYGSKKNPLKRMALHAGELSFIHPVTHELMKFYIKIPVCFEKLMKKRSN